MGQTPNKSENPQTNPQQSKGGEQQKSSPSTQGNQPGTKDTSAGGKNPQSPKQPSGGQPPRYDDRPQRDDRTGGQTNRPGQSSTSETGTGPGYGDMEPGDPRRSNIEASNKNAGRSTTGGDSGQKPTGGSVQG